MNVLVIGATGFIGFPTAQALSRAGHVVYGLARKETQIQKLRASEIIPVQGDAADPTTWISMVRTVDVVIECIGGPQTRQLSTTVFDAISTAVQELRPPTVPKLTYLYTSGAWVHGENRLDIASDTTILGNGPALTAWRRDFEQLIVKSTLVNGIVIRPGLLYGYSGSITSMMFAQAEQGKLEWYGKPGGRVGFIHADDLADLYVKVTEKAPFVGGMIFDSSNDQTEGFAEVFQKMFEVIGVKGEVNYVEPGNPWHQALSTTVLMRPYLAKTLLGWQPKKMGFLDGMKIYYAAWKASQ